MYKAFHSLFMPIRFYLLVVLLFISGTVSAFDGSPELVNDLILKATENGLWKKKEWLNLIHYKSAGDGYVSQVDDERFFYAKEGKYSSHQELIATIKQLFIATEDNNQQTQCRFIARTEWLSSQLNIQKSQLPEVDCSEYREWYTQAHGDRVTLIFPAYHLNSPSSMFGHTLLRLDKSGIPNSEWISFAVNFGADTSSNDNSFVYAYQGLVGGYPGLFITEPYFKKIQEYNHIEHRDIWEYRLNLTPSETDRMIKHLWELKTVNFDYYFFDENCSYRLLELIEIARPGIELTDEFKLTAIPVDTVRAIENAQLIEAVKFRPSQVSEIQYMLTQLPEPHRDLVLQLSKDISVSKTVEFTRLNATEKKKIAALSYKYLRYQNATEARKPEIVKRSYQLLELLNSYPAEINVKTSVPVPSAPEKGHKSKRWSIGVGEALNHQYIDLGFKMSFHDLKDNQSGFLQGAQINMGNIKFRIEEEDGLQLNQFDIVDIFSLTPRNNFFSPLSWKVKTGFERQLSNNKDILVYQLTGGAGGAWEIQKDHILYTLATLRLEINKNMKTDLEPAIGFDSGLISHFTGQTSHLEISGEQFEEDLYRIRLQYTHNFVLSTNQSIKLTAKKQWQEKDTEFTNVSLNYQAYF